MKKKKKIEECPLLLSDLVALAKAEYEKEKDSKKTIEWLNDYSPLYYKYAGIKEYYDLLIELNAKLGEETEVWRLKYLKNVILGVGSDEEELYHTYQKTILEQIRRYYETDDDLPIIKELLSLFYITNRVFEYAVTEALLVKLTNKRDIEKKSYIDKRMNIAYFRQEVSRACIWVIVAGSSNIVIEELMANFLFRLGHKVYLINVPADGCIYGSEEMALQASFENKLDYSDITIISASLYREKDGSQTDDTAAILTHIWEKLAADSYINVLGEESQIDRMSTIPSLNKNFSRLDRKESQLFNKNLSFAWAGNYLGYLDRLYGISVEELLDQPEEIVFSIVIPARNSAKYLRHTIMTCLNQRFTESFEIIISDNSVKGNHEIYELCLTFNDSRIRYLKPQSELSLAKSFEFAFLHAKGKYILGVGSDDGLLPWTLETLHLVWEKYPEEEIIQWDIVNYMHADYHGGAWAANSFYTSRGYFKGDINVSYTKLKSMLTKALYYPFMMYHLPLLYINSGFKRSYFSILLEKTGRLWDGISQDIYMGVVNAAINDQVLHIQYPLTIAGQSAISFGAQYSYIYSQNLKSQPETPSGGVGYSIYEQLVPDFTMDYSVLYLNFMRAYARGIIPEWMNVYIDFKVWFDNVVCQLDKENIVFDALLHRVRFAAMRHGEEFLHWFDENIYNKIVQKEVKKDVAENENYVQDGVTEEGNITLCLDKYGVTNIYEMTKIFQKIVQL